MAKNVIESDTDLFEMSFPTIEPNGKLKPAAPLETKTEVSQNQDKNLSSFIKDNTVLSYSICAIVVVFVIILFYIVVKKLSKNRNPMAEYTKQQTKKFKQEQAYISSSNKLETPDNILDCIRAFIERTK